MIEFICDECGEHIKNVPNEMKDDLSGKHYCRKCVMKWIREQAKKVVDAPLEHAPYGQLLCIYQNLSGAYLNAMDIRTPWELPKCPVCESEMKTHNPAARDYFCEKCMAIYDRFGKKVRDVEVKE